MPTALASHERHNPKEAVTCVDLLSWGQHAQHRMGLHPPGCTAHQRRSPTPTLGGTMVTPQESLNPSLLSLQPTGHPLSVLLHCKVKVRDPGAEFCAWSCSGAIRKHRGPFCLGAAWGLAHPTGSESRDSPAPPCWPGETCVLGARAHIALCLRVRAARTR